MFLGSLTTQHVCATPFGRAYTLQLMKIRVMPLRQSSISLIMKNNMVSIVDWHVVKSTIICNCYWILLCINWSKRDLPRLKAQVDNTLEDFVIWSTSPWSLMKAGMYKCRPCRLQTMQTEDFLKLIYHFHLFISSYHYFFT